MYICGQIDKLVFNKAFESVHWRMVLGPVQTRCISAAWHDKLHVIRTERQASICTRNYSCAMVADSHKHKTRSQAAGVGEKGAVQS